MSSWSAHRGEWEPCTGTRVPFQMAWTVAMPNTAGPLSSMTPAATRAPASTAALRVPAAVRHVSARRGPAGRPHWCLWPGMRGAGWYGQRVRCCPSCPGRDGPVATSAKPVLGDEATEDQGDRSPGSRKGMRQCPGCAVASLLLRGGQCRTTSLEMRGAYAYRI